jgi:MoaA/NifB/PqqE/SkfB family radical SAM enzyme
MELIIDVIGACNLTCPSCPVGNSPHVKNTKGVMDSEKLRAILVKAMGECSIESVSLFNWTDPLINPNLPKLVRTVKELGLNCMISSNLNYLKNEDELMKSAPDVFRISMSGYSQENYGINHRGGDIRKVLENLEKLVESKSRTKSSTVISILYHRYLGNLDDEYKLREIADKWGIVFETCWAYLMPLEKILAFAYDDPRISPLNKEDRDVIKRLALPFDEAISIATKNRSRACSLLENQIVMDVRGDVVLCCGIYNQSKYKLGNFLERPLSEIIKDKHELDNCKELCKKCTEKGIHVYAVYGSPEFDRVATQNVLQQYAETVNVKIKPYEKLIHLLARYAPTIFQEGRKVRGYLRKNGF